MPRLGESRPGKLPGSMGSLARLAILAVAVSLLLLAHAQTSWATSHQDGDADVGSPGDDQARKAPIQGAMPDMVDEDDADAQQLGKRARARGKRGGTQRSTGLLRRIVIRQRDLTSLPTTPL